MLFILSKADLDHVPMWWKTPTDRALTTFVIAATVGSFVVSLKNVIQYARGKL